VPYLLFLFCYVLSLSACPQKQSQPDVQKLFFPVGDKNLVFTKTVYAGTGNAFFLQLHDNEVTAEEAALEYIKQNGGVLLSIENEGNRNVSFTLGNQSYTFDPNRIFTPVGLEATLQRLSKATPEAMAAVTQLADSILKYLPPSALVIAVHNNTNQGFSISSYISDTTYQRDAAAVHTNAAHDVDNFFLTTDKTLYDEVVTKNYNIILQDNVNATDDGSLSVYLGKKGVPYINVEAELGHLQFQLQMITDLLRQKN